VAYFRARGTAEGRRVATTTFRQPIQAISFFNDALALPGLNKRQKRDSSPTRFVRTQS